MGVFVNTRGVNEREDCIIINIIYLKLFANSKFRAGLTNPGPGWVRVKFLKKSGSGFFFEKIRVPGQKSPGQPGAIPGRVKKPRVSKSPGRETRPGAHPWSEALKPEALRPILGFSEKFILITKLFYLFYPI